MKKKIKSMKGIIYCFLFIAVVLSCSKNKSASLNEISYEEAVASQTIKFQLGNSDGGLRTIELTNNFQKYAQDAQIRNYGFPTSDKTDLVPFDADKEILITYGVRADLPTEQSLENHSESVKLHFGKIEDAARIYTGNYGETGYFSNELFRKELLKVGKADPSFINFSFNQTYLWTSGFPKGIDMTIDKIESISGHEDKIFVSGNFNGDTFHGNDPGFQISDGSFKIILENHYPL